MYMYVAFSCTLHAAACLDCLYLLLGWLRPTYEQYVCQNMSNMFATGNCQNMRLDMQYSCNMHGNIRKETHIAVKSICSAG